MAPAETTPPAAAAAETPSARRVRAPGAFSVPAYRRLWAGASIIALANWGERLAVGWLVLTETDSVLATASTMALRSAPGILVAPFAGAVADRVPRQRLLFAAALAKAAVAVAIGLVALGGISSPWSVLPLVALIGAASSFEAPSTQALITDIVDHRQAMSAISLQATGSRAIGVLGALAAGVIADRAGVAPALFAAAGVFVLGGLVVITIRAPARARAQKRAGLAAEALDGMRTMAAMPAVATLLVMAMVVEIFGFAYNAVLPAVARDVLHVQATGYGSLAFMSGVGAVFGVLALSLLGDHPRKALIVLAITLSFGTALVAFGSSTSFVLSMALVAWVGAMAAAFDAMQSTLLQARVPDDMRGRAVAAWVFAIGFGWIGHLLLGAAAEGIGVQWALRASGGMVLLTGLAAVVVFRRVRID